MKGISTQSRNKLAPVGLVQGLAPIRSRRWFTVDRLTRLHSWVEMPGSCEKEAMR